MGEKKCGTMMDEDFQCTGKAVRQNVDFEGNDEEREQKHNRDWRRAAGKDGGWAANRYKGKGRTYRKNMSKTEKVCGQERNV